MTTPIHCHVYVGYKSANLTLGHYRDGVDHFDPGLSVEVMINTASFGQPGYSVGVSLAGISSHSGAFAVLRAGLYEEAGRLASIAERLLNTEGFTVEAALRELSGAARFEDMVWHFPRGEVAL